MEKKDPVFWPLTVVVLTKNESSRMGRLLPTVVKAQKVVILDSFSTDETLLSAAKVWTNLGRKGSDIVLVESVWKGFVNGRNESLKWVLTPWVLWLDADEWIDKSLEEEFNAFFQPADSQQKDIYSFPRLTTFLGRPIYHGGWWPDKKTRLARKDKALWVAGPLGAQVHETLVLNEPNSGGVGSFRSPIQHETFRDIKELQETNDRYSSLLAKPIAQKFFQEGRRAPRPFYICIKVGIKFLENYVWKRGFLDGYPGLVIALGSAKSMGMRLKKVGIFIEKLKRGESLETTL